MELKVLQVGDGHGDLSTIELLVVLDLRGSCRCHIVPHGDLNLAAGADLKSAIEQVDVKEVVDGVGLVLQSQRLLHLVQVCEREGHLLALLCLGDDFNEVTGGLSKHDRVVSFIGGNGTDSGEQLGEARVRLIAGTTTGSTSFLDIINGLTRQGRLESGEEMMA